MRRRRADRHPSIKFRLARCAGEPSDEAHATWLEDFFTDAREAEWRELLPECEAFAYQIDRASSGRRFVYTELERAEQGMERMRRRFREIRRRDILHAPSSGHAGIRLKECGKILDDFAGRVCEAGETS
jgi:hypothetical protein